MSSVSVTRHWGLFCCNNLETLSCGIKNNLITYAIYQSIKYCVTTPWQIAYNCCYYLHEIHINLDLSRPHAQERGLLTQYIWQVDTLHWSQKKWRPFETHVLVWIFLFGVVTKVPSTRKQVLLQIMAWCLKCVKPLSEALIP